MGVVRYGHEHHAALVAEHGRSESILNFLRPLMIPKVLVVQVANRINLMTPHFIHEPELELLKSNLCYFLEYFVGLGEAEIVIEFVRTDAQRYDL